MKNSTIAYLTRHTGIDIRQLGRGISWLFFSQVIASAAGFFLTVVLANLLSESDFGTYKYLMSIIGIASIIAFSGFASALVRAVARGFEGELKRLVRLSLWYNLGVGVFALGFAIYYLLAGNDTLGYGSLIIAITTPLTITYSLFASYLNGAERYRSYAISSMVYTVVPALLTIAAAYMFPTSVLTLFALFVVSQTVLAILFYLGTIWYTKPNQALDDTTLHLGNHLSIMNVLGNLTFQLDRFLAWHLVGPIGLAVYSVATAPPQQLRYFNKIISTIALPRFSQRSLRSLQSTMTKKLVVSFLFGLSLVIPYWFAAPIIFELFFPKYTEAVLYSQVFSLVMLFFPAAVLQETLKAHVHTRALYILQVGLPILKIVLLLSLIPTIGLWGIFATQFILEGLRLFITLFWFYTMRDSDTTTPNSTTTLPTETDLA